MFLDPSMERDLQLIAERERRSTASVVREALGAWIAERKTVRPRRPGFVAAGRSGTSDTAERHEALLFADPAPAPRASSKRAASPPRRKPAR